MISSELVNVSMVPVDEAIRDFGAGEVRAEIARRNIDAKHLAIELGLSVHPLYKMLSAVQEFKPEYIDKIRAHFSMPPDWPFNDSAVREHRAHYGEPRLDIPVLSMIDDPGATIAVPSEYAGHGWTAFVQPDTSNMPEVSVGDVLTFCETVKPRFGYAHILVLPTNPGQPVMRHIVHREGKDYLVALNKHIDPQPVDGELLGIVTGWIHEDPPGFDKRINPAGLRWLL